MLLKNCDSIEESELLARREIMMVLFFSYICIVISRD